MTPLIRRLYCSFTSWMTHLQSPFLLGVRFYWGWLLAQSGWGKLHHLSKVTEFFTSLHLPLPGQMAILISCVELFGGIFLALGLLSRLTGLIVSFTMFMAYITADLDALLSFLSQPDRFYTADPFTFLAAALIVLVFGAGAASIDRAFATRFRVPANSPQKNPV